MPESVCWQEPRLMAGEAQPTRRERQQIWSEGRIKGTEMLRAARMARFKRPRTRADVLREVCRLPKYHRRSKRSAGEAEQGARKAARRGERIGEASHPGP